MGRCGGANHSAKKSQLPGKLPRCVVSRGSRAKPGHKGHTTRSVR